MFDYMNDIDNDWHEYTLSQGKFYTNPYSSEQMNSWQVFGFVFLLSFFIHFIEMMNEFIRKDFIFRVFLPQAMLLIGFVLKR